MAHKLIATITVSTTASVTITSPAKFDAQFEKVKRYQKPEYSKDDLLKSILYRAVVRREDVTKYGCAIQYGRGTSQITDVRSGENIEF